MLKRLLNRRALAVLLSAIMVLNSVPQNAYADYGETSGSSGDTVIEVKTDDINSDVTTSEETKKNDAKESEVDQQSTQAEASEETTAAEEAATENEANETEAAQITEEAATETSAAVEETETDQAEEESSESETAAETAEAVEAIETSETTASVDGGTTEATEAAESQPATNEAEGQTTEAQETATETQPAETAIDVKSAPPSPEYEENWEHIRAMAEQWKDAAGGPIGKSYRSWVLGLDMQVSPMRSLRAATPNATGDPSLYWAGGYSHTYNRKDYVEFINGWHLGGGYPHIVFAYLYSPTSNMGNITEKGAAYCIAPSDTARYTGDPLSSYDASSFIASKSNWNDILTSKQIETLLSYVMYYGFSGDVGQDNRFGNIRNEDKENWCKAYATQILVWEVIVGERKADFSKRDVAYANSVLGAMDNLPADDFNKIKTYYNSIAANVQNQLKTPSFLNEVEGSATVHELVYNGTVYTTTLTDTNGALSAWTITSSDSNVTCTKNGNSLTISSSAPVTGTVTITGKRNVNSKSMLLLSQASVYVSGGMQPTITPLSTISVEKKAYVKVNSKAESGVTITKVSSNPSYTNGNAMYTLAGIQYGIYTNAQCTTLARDTSGNDAKVTLNAQGKAPTVKLAPGIYYVKEIETSVLNTGFLYNPDIKTVTLTAGSTESVVFTNQPRLDPLRISIQKVDATGKVITSVSLADAQFTVKYYDSIFQNASNAPATAKQTWVYKTGADGSVRLSDSSALISGDLTVISGQSGFLLGTLVITETKAPTNFLTTSDVWTATIQLKQLANGDEGTELVIYKNGAEVNRVTSDQTAIDPILVNEPGEDISATLKKVDGNGKPLAGVKFKLTGTGIPTSEEEKTTGTDGTITWTGIPWVEGGVTATLTETYVPDGYGLDPEYAPPGKTYTISAQPGGTYNLGTITNYEDSGFVKVQKIVPDNATSDGSGFSFRLWGTSDKGTAYDVTQVTGAGGTTTFSNVPVGTYNIQEILTAEQEKIWEAKDKDTVRVTRKGEEVNFTLRNTPLTGPAHVIKTSEDGKVDGFVFELTGTKSIGGTFTVQATTDVNGKADFGQVPYGTYTVEEKLTTEQAKIYKVGSITPATFTLSENNKSQEVKAENTLLRGGVSIPKRDRIKADGTAQGDASLAGIRFAVIAQFDTFHKSGTVVKAGTVIAVMTTDANGNAATGPSDLPMGTYLVQEIRKDAVATVGQALVEGTSIYSNDSYLWDVYSEEVTVSTPDMLTAMTVGAKNEPVSGGAGLQKFDSETSNPEPQGDASFDGIEFAIVNRSAIPVVINGTEYAPGMVVMIVTTDKNGNFATANDALAYGTYEVIELSLEHTTRVGTAYSASQNGKSVYANTNGYLYQAQSEQIEVREQGKVYHCDFSDPVVRGGVKFVKTDAEKEVYNGPDQLNGQGDATLEGAEISIYNMSNRAVIVGGVEYAHGDIVKMIATNANGIAETAANLLPYGTYRAVETKASRGYLLNTEWSVDFQIREEGVVLDTTDVINKGADKTTVLNYDSGIRRLDNGKLPEEPIRGGVSFEKYDAETGLNKPQGDATLEGAEIGIYNISGQAVYVIGESGQAKWVLSAALGLSRDALIATEAKVLSVFTDADGKAATDIRALPYGTYKAVELHPSNGYLTNDTWYVIFQIREDGVVIETANSAFYDENGAAGEKSCYYEYNTGAVSRTAQDGRLLEEIKRNDLTWEKLNIDGITKARIPFALDRMEMVNGEWVVVESHVIVSDDDGIVNTGAAFTDRGRANSLDQYVTNGVFAPDSALDPTVGVWFGDQTEDKSTRGALIYGTYRIRELSCTDNLSHKEDLLVSDLIYIHDDYEMKGGIEDRNKPIELLPQNTRVFGHHALIDLEVELTSVALETESRTHSVPARENVTVIDTIHYTHLKETSKYRMEVTLMVADTAIIIGTYSKEFVPERSASSPLVKTAEGTVEISCTFDARPYEGKRIASVVRLYSIMDDINGPYEVLISYHNTDHKDLEQEVAVPTMITSAIDTATGDNVGAKRPNKESGEKTFIMDTVELRFLAPQERYMLVGKLVDRETGEVLAEAHEFVFTSRRSPDDNAKIHYVDMADTYTIKMPAFEIDTAYLRDRTLVVFESLYRCEITNGGQTVVRIGDPILVHESAIGVKEYDSNADDEFYHHNGQQDDNRDQSRWYGSQIDEAQSVHYVDIYTEAKDGNTDDHVGTVKTDAVINDEVRMTNLIPGMTYTIKGTLVYQSDFVDENGVSHKKGDAVPFKDGSVSTLTFVATKSEETKTLTYIVDSTLLAGTTVVVFEGLYHNDVLIAWHNDIEDDEQSVYYPKVSTSAKNEATGGHVGSAQGTITITDTVTYANLVVGESYTITGTLMDKSTGKALTVGGKAITATTGEFIAARKSGFVTLTFTFKADLLDGITDLSGRTLVVFEKLFHPNSETGQPVEVARHEDINDQEQSILFPKFSTNAKVGNLDETAIRDAEGNYRDFTIIDTVSYENLWKGATYTLVGYLMDKNTGEQLLDDAGNPVYGIAVFTTDQESGTVGVEFKLNAKNFTDKVTGETRLEGVTLVVFEDLYYGEFTSPASVDSDKHIGEHHDLNDVAQDIRLPKGRTHAQGEPADSSDAHGADESAKDHEVLASKSMSITDVVTYEKLHGGTEYTVVGRLMDKVTGKPMLDDNGKEITATKTFVTEGNYDDEVSGSVTIVFTFDGVKLAGKTTVAFETISREGQDVIVHADLKDDAQTVHIPKIETFAIIENMPDGLRDVPLAQKEKLVIYDRVTYTNLRKGFVYTVKGVLIDQATGNPILVDGKQVTAERNFVAGAPDTMPKSSNEIIANLTSSIAADGTDYEGVSGTVTLRFELDASSLKGKTVVVFENLYNEDKLVAVHHDVNDVDQSVNFPEIGTKARDKATGKQTLASGASVTLVDTVSYKNLTPGQTYVVKGEIMDKATGKSIGIFAEARFVATAKDGQAVVEFTFNTSQYLGKTLVVFEKLYDTNGNLIAEHADINDPEQAVIVTTPPPAGPPEMGDFFDMQMHALMFAVALAALMTVLMKKRKEQAE